jgi:hypothetical protein
MRPSSSKSRAKLVFHRPVVLTLELGPTSAAFEPDSVRLHSSLRWKRSSYEAFVNGSMPPDASPDRGVNGSMHADGTLFDNRQPVGTVTTSTTDGIAESCKYFQSREQER